MQGLACFFLYNISYMAEGQKDRTLPVVLTEIVEVLR